LFYVVFCGLCDCEILGEWDYNYLYYEFTFRHKH